MPGYIQCICAVSFSVLLYTEQSDAAGSILERNAIYINKTLILLACLSHDCPPIAAIELISTEHSVLAISHFLECFRRECKNRRGNDCCINKNSFYHISMQNWRNVSIFAVMNPFEK